MVLDVLSIDFVFGFHESLLGMIVQKRDVEFQKPNGRPIEAFSESVPSLRYL